MYFLGGGCLHSATPPALLASLLLSPPLPWWCGVVWTVILAFALRLVTFKHHMCSIPVGYPCLPHACCLLPISPIATHTALLPVPVFSLPSHPLLPVFSLPSVGWKDSNMPFTTTLLPCCGVEDILALHCTFGHVCLPIYLVGLWWGGEVETYGCDPSIPFVCLMPLCCLTPLPPHSPYVLISWGDGR